jgi:hypothetical protein
MPPLAQAIATFLSAVLAGTVVADTISDASEISLGTAITVFGVAFGAWAVVLGWVMFVVRREFAELRQFVRQESERQRVADDRAHQDRLIIERRLTEIEVIWKNHRQEIT